MTQHLSTIRFLHSGWCSQFARLVGAPSWTWTRFYAVFVYFEHPEHGGCLIDTAYSDEFFHATRWLPQRLYRWLTPVHLDEQGAANFPDNSISRRALAPGCDVSPERKPDASAFRLIPPEPLATPDEQRNARDRLSAAGIDPAGVRQIFVSHFHADHIAGLKCFPNAQFIYRREAFDRLQRQSVFAQVRHGYLRELIPPDFTQRGRPLDETRFTADEGDWQGFQVCDFWGDGSLRLVDLPGHADGHFGFVLQSADTRLFYIVDACWHLQVLLDNSPLPWISRRIQHDATAYFATQEKLRQLTERTGIELIACHCPRTLHHVS